MRGFHQLQPGREDIARLERFLFERAPLPGERPAWLSDREWGILVGRFIHRTTLRELGVTYGITGERVRQIELKALRKSRRWLRPDASSR